MALFWRRDNLNSRLGRFLEGIFQTIDLKELKIELVVQAYEPGKPSTYGYAVKQPLQWSHDLWT